LTETAVERNGQGPFQRIQETVTPGETLYTLFDCQGEEIAFVGITDRRIILQRQGNSVGDGPLVSVAYDQVIGVAINDEGVAAYRSTPITLITTVGSFAFTPSAADVAHWAYRFIIDKVYGQR
jgi:hypothetical protein